MPSLQLVSYFTTAAGTTGSAAAAVAGDSLQMFASSRKPKILDWWGSNQTTGFHRLLFQSGHDMIQGLPVPVVASELDPLMTMGLPIEVEPSETMQPTIAGSATAGDVETGSWNIYYADGPGGNANFIDWQTLKELKENQTTVKQTIVGAAAGYTGQAALSMGALKTGRWYALEGISVNVDVNSVCIIGGDTGNVWMGVPGDAADQDRTKNYFCLLSRMYGLPLIPIFNASNTGNTFVRILQNENNISPICYFHFALLERKPAGKK